MPPTDPHTNKEIAWLKRQLFWLAAAFLTPFIIGLWLAVIYLAITLWRAL